MMSPVNSEADDFGITFMEKKKKGSFRATVLTDVSLTIYGALNYQNLNTK